MILITVYSVVSFALYFMLKFGPLFSSNDKYKIDEEVVNCAIRYLRGICGDSLDNLSSEHHKVDNNIMIHLYTV